MSAQIHHCFILLLACLGVPLAAQEPLHHAQGEMAGEVTATTALLQSRLTSAPGLLDGDVPGAAGWARFRYAESPDFAGAGETPWIEARAENDFIVRAALRGLQPGRVYHYRLEFGRDREHVMEGPLRRFKTLPAPDASAPFRFVVGSCINYGFFMNGPNGTGKNARADAEDRRLGFPALAAMRRLDPDFFVGMGDNVYYDHPAKSAAQTLPELRRKWHEQFVLPRFVELFAVAPTYWIKDDHDHRYNDSDRTGDKAPSHELGVRTFREQMPVVAVVDSNETTYRTHRVGRWLQLWLVENRDYRSPNKSPDGPDKTIWGVEQKAWLLRTILASDAPFKLLLTPTPMVGPDDAYKTDNHVNHDGFRTEGESFLAWLKAKRQDNFHIITGDRHWHYHSIHPTGIEEFSAGALHVENARRGRAPGDPKSTDPQALVRQLYTDAKPTGGFLFVELTPAPDGTAARLRFSIRDEQGAELYTDEKTAVARPAGSGEPPR